MHTGMGEAATSPSVNLLGQSTASLQCSAARPSPATEVMLLVNWPCCQSVGRLGRAAFLASAFPSFKPSHRAAAQLEKFSSP